MMTDMRAFNFTYVLSGETSRSARLLKHTRDLKLTPAERSNGSGQQVQHVRRGAGNVHIERLLLDQATARGMFGRTGIKADGR